MVGGEITRSTRRVNKRNQEKERIKRGEKPVAFLSGTERYRSTPGERAPKCDPHAANPARTRVRRRGRDWDCCRGQGVEEGRGGRGEMTDDDFPTHDDCVCATYVYARNARERLCPWDGNCRKRRMMIFRSDDPAYVKRGEGAAMRSRVSFANKFRGSVGTEIVAFLVPIARTMTSNSSGFLRTRWTLSFRGSHAYPFNCTRLYREGEG